MEEIFKAYDIRGVYPEEINETIMEKIGFAFASYLNKKNIVIGHDMRNSSPALSKAFSDGVRAFGSDVFDIGLSTFLMVYVLLVQMSLILDFQQPLCYTRLLLMVTMMAEQ